MFDSYVIIILNNPKNIFHLCSGKVLWMLKVLHETISANKECSF